MGGRVDGGSGLAVALLGWWWHCRGARAVMGVGRRVRCCWGRRAAAPGLKREVTINLLLGGACGKVQGGGGARCLGIRHGIRHGRQW